MKHRINTNGVCVNCGLSAMQKLTTVCFGKQLSKRTISKINEGNWDYNGEWVAVEKKHEPVDPIKQLLESIKEYFPDIDIEIVDLNSTTEINNEHQLMDFIYRNGPCTLDHILSNSSMDENRLIELLRAARSMGVVSGSITSGFQATYEMTPMGRLMHGFITDTDSKPASVLLTDTDLFVLMKVARSKPIPAYIYQNAANGISANKLLNLGLIEEKNDVFCLTALGRAHIDQLLQQPVLPR